MRTSGILSPNPNLNLTPNASDINAANTPASTTANSCPTNQVATPILMETTTEYFLSVNENQIQTLKELTKALPACKRYNPIKTFVNSIFQKNSIDANIPTLVKQQKRKFPLECLSSANVKSQELMKISQKMSDSLLNSVDETEITKLFASAKTDFSTLEKTYNEFLDWINKDLVSLRERVQKGVGTSLTEEQIKLDAHQLRYSITPEIMKEDREKSQINHEKNQKLLNLIDTEWDHYCLTLAEIDKNFCIINIFKDLLFKVKELRKEENLLAANINKIYLECETIEYRHHPHLHIESKLEETLPFAILTPNRSDQFERSEKLIYEFDKALSACEEKRKDLFKLINKLDREIENFNDNLSSFVKFLTHPESKNVKQFLWQNYSQNNKKVKELHNLLKAEWNEASLCHFTAKQELNLAKCILSVFPQLQDITCRVDALTYSARNTRKTVPEENKTVALLNDLIDAFKNLKSSLFVRNGYFYFEEVFPSPSITLSTTANLNDITITDTPIHPQSFYNLYDCTIKKIEDEINALNDNDADKRKKLIDSIEILLYDDSKAISQLDQRIKKLEEIQKSTIEKITTRYNNLSTKPAVTKLSPLEKLDFELNRIHYAIQYVKNNKKLYFSNGKQIQDITNAYSIESLALSWRATGNFNHFKPITRPS